jgi:DNA-binding HxlR family transcriptional regulator
MHINNLPSFADCPLPAALDAMGERWSFLILRGAMSGIRHFEDFQTSLGIARNILSNRLVKLVDNGILERQVMACDKRKVQYLLTDKGRALAPVMVALRQWAQQWGDVGGNCGPLLVERATREPVRPMAILSQSGEELELYQLMWLDSETAIA